MATPSLLSRMIESQWQDAEIVSIRDRVQSGTGDEGWTVHSDGSLQYRGWVVVPHSTDLREEILKEFHCSRFAVHLGGTKIYQDLRRQYYWSGMKRHVGDFVRQCLTCQQVKAELSRPIPYPTRLADPNRVRVRDCILLGLIDLFFLRAELVPVVLQTISVITKIIFIYKRTTTRVVSINIYIHILSPIYFYMYIFFFSNTKHQRSQKQCGEHLSLSWPALLMWDVLSSILVFCFCTYMD